MWREHELVAAGAPAAVPDRRRGDAVRRERELVLAGDGAGRDSRDGWPGHPVAAVRAGRAEHLGGDRGRSLAAAWLGGTVTLRVKRVAGDPVAGVSVMVGARATRLRMGLRPLGDRERVGNRCLGDDRAGGPLVKERACRG